ncbi:MAG: hypothetical protein HC927_04820 [Deltaproteobacteria bacterium]|nr:hypothetical protein [Deltaproteobacteria bacterium]
MLRTFTTTGDSQGFKFTMIVTDGDTTIVDDPRLTVLPKGSKPGSV